MRRIIDLPPEVESRLQAEASRQGVPAAIIALHLVTDNLQPAAPLIIKRPEAKNQQIAAEDWEQIFDAGWIVTPPMRPPLTRKAFAA